jgi:hypothetical protein
MRVSYKVKIYHWLPRIICILAILLISLFALDAFQPNLSIWEQIGAFLMHLIPSFILTVLLLIAWKWEYIGGIIFTISGLGLSPIVFMHNYNMNHSIWMSLGVICSITLPFVVIGVLFIRSHLYKNKHNK